MTSARIGDMESQFNIGEARISMSRHRKQSSVANALELCEEHMCLADFKVQWNVYKLRLFGTLNSQESTCNELQVSTEKGKWALLAAVFEWSSELLSLIEARQWAAAGQQFAVSGWVN